MSTSEHLTIGQLAEATGVSISAIRYYEQRNLVSPIGRDGGQRRFATDAVDRLQFVTRAKQAGFTLEQIGVLLDDSTGETRSVLASRLHEMKQTRADLDVAISFVEAASKCGCANLAQCALASER